MSPPIISNFPLSTCLCLDCYCWHIEHPWLVPSVSLQLWTVTVSYTVNYFQFYELNIGLNIEEIHLILIESLYSPTHFHLDYCLSIWLKRWWIVIQWKLFDWVGGEYFLLFYLNLLTIFLPLCSEIYNIIAYHNIISYLWWLSELGQHYLQLMSTSIKIAREHLQMENFKILQNMHLKIG